MLDKQTLINNICMDSPKTEMTFLVEGESDGVVLRHFMDKYKANVYPCGGKTDVLDVYDEICQRNHAKYVYAIVDLDYNWYFNNRREDSHIVYTDAHDFDIMFYMSECFERVVSCIYSSGKLSRFESSNTFRDYISQIAIHMGLFRIYNIQEKLNLKFKPVGNQNELKYSKFIKKTKFTGDEDMINTVKSYYNQKPGLDVEKTKKGLAEITRNENDKYLILHGHDVANIMSEIWKDMPKSNTKFDCRENIEACMRSAYCFDNFKKTDMFNTMSQLANMQGVDIWKN